MPQETTFEPGQASVERPTFRIETHGCKLNMADSQKLAGDFLAAGFRAAGPGDLPSVFVLNSCTVTSTADKKARRAVSYARRRYPSALVVASGCYPERDRDAFEESGAADLVVGNREKDELAGMVAGIIGLPSPLGVSPVDRIESLRSVGRSRASVKIQEGCDQVCAYCIVPKVRGRERSVPPETIVAQVDELAAGGCAEVVLTGTQLGSYGFDLPDANLPKLLREVLAKTGIPRLRVSSLQPLEVTEELLDVWTSSQGAGRLCPHFHMPLQSGSDTILRRMRRRYTPDEYEESVRRVRKAVPGASITTDVICGFPGETERDHAATLALMRRVGFAAAHVFPYSGRPGTSAAHFRDSVDGATKSRRASEARRVAAVTAADYRRRAFGELRTALWEGEGGESGLTEDYLRVRRAAGVSAANGGGFERVRIVGFDGGVVLVETGGLKGSVAFCR